MPPTASSSESSSSSTPTPTRCCSNCGATDKKLRSCSRCHLASYCGRDCQREHWKKRHKLDCDMACLSLQSLKQQQAAASGVVDVEEAARAQSKTMRKIAKLGMPTATVSWTAFGLVGPGTPVQAGVPSNFALKQEATQQLRMGPPTKANARGNLKGEAAYKAYYDDIVENYQDWMTFFDHPDNSEHAEHTCGILGTLATIYRQRGTYAECEAVLDMEAQVMTRYRKHSQGVCVEQVTCCDGLEYKMNKIRYNLCYDLARYDESAALFRDLARYELQYNLSYEDQEYLFMIDAVLGMPPTAATLQSLSDTQVMMMVKAPLFINDTPEHAREVEQKRQRVALVQCAGCGKSETAMATFKVCPRCQTAYFCGRGCQKSNWKAHKKVCCKR